MTAFVIGHVDYYTCGRILLSPSLLLLSNAPDISLTCGWRPRCCGHVRTSIETPALIARNARNVRRTDRREKTRTGEVYFNLKRDDKTHLRDTPMQSLKRIFRDTRARSGGDNKLREIAIPGESSLQDLDPRKGVSPLPPPSSRLSATLPDTLRYLARDESVDSRAKVKIWAARDTAAFAHCRRAGKRPAPAAESRLRPASPYHLGHWVRPGPAKPGKRDPHPLPWVSLSLSRARARHARRIDRPCTGSSDVTAAIMHRRLSLSRRNGMRRPQYAKRLCVSHGVACFAN